MTTTHTSPFQHQTVDRRRFLKLAGLSAAALLGAPRGATAASIVPRIGSFSTAPANGVYTLPPLPYDYAALEPHIDTLTMQIHHGRHHAAYVTNLNTALKDYPAFHNRDATDLITRLNELPEAIRTAVRNNAGGHVNHAIFWALMSPQGGGEPAGPLAAAISSTFGTFANFKQMLNDAGTRRFGSGWAWLVLDRAGRLQITSTANQDSPYMEGQVPLLGVDVWEHAYYLKYQNRRADYLAAWWNVVNWHAVEQRYTVSLGS